MSENPNAALQDYQQAQANLAALEHSAETDMAALGGKEKAAQVPRRRLGQELDQAQKVPARLTADQAKAACRGREEGDGKGKC